MDGNLPPRKSCHEMDATKIDELITKGQIDVQCGRTAEAKRHAREAHVRAEEAMHRYLQSDADTEAEKKLTDWFRESCALFSEIGEFPMALKCFYLATCFDDQWTTETHTRVSQTLWNKMHDIQQEQRSSTVEEIQQLLGDITIIADITEKRRKFELCLSICTDFENQQPFMINKNKYSSLMRRARCLFQMNRHKEVLELTCRVLNTFNKHDDEAQQLLEMSVQASLNKKDADFGTVYSNVEITLPRKKKKRRKRKARNRNTEANIEVTDIVEEKLNSSSQIIGVKQKYPRQVLQKTTYVRTGNYQPGLNNVVQDQTSDMRNSDSESLGYGFDTTDETDESIEDRPVSFEQDEMDASTEDIDFYEQSVFMYKGDKIPFCHEEEQWVKKGMDLQPHFVHQFSPKTKFDKIYEQCENATQLQYYLDSDPQKYIRCIIQHDGCHEAKCMPVSKIEGCSVIHISGRSKIGRTFNGDEVVVELLDKTNTSDNKTGNVIGTLKRHRFADIKHPVFVCTVDDTGSYLLRPMCKTVPKIKIRTNRMQTDENNSTFTLYNYDMQTRVLRKSKDFHVAPKESKFVYLVVMITWNERFPYPLGAIIKILPWGNTITNGLRILNMQFDVPSVYSKKVVKQVKRLETLEGFDEPGLQKQQNRRNCAHLDAFTIDPPNAKDLDDALSLELVDGGYRVGVHIADVSEYVTKDSSCDIEAKERSCTFYPEIQRARHMLPEPLSVQKCSLLAGKIRLAISVFYIFGSNGQLRTFNLISCEIAKTIIQSRRQFTYKEAQNILSKGLPDCDVDKIENDMKILFKIATELRKKRLGNAMFYSKQVFDDENDDNNTVEAHYLVEEFMILTNFSVGKILYEHFPDCVPVRYQPPPSEENMQEFLTKNDIYVDVVTRLQDKCLGGKVRGLHTLLSMEKDALDRKYVVVPKQVRQRITDRTVSPKQVLTCDHLFPMQYVVNMHWICIQEMAGYVCCTGKTSDATDGKHYDLDVFPYVHFTSPIRRYIDLVVHRLLRAYLHKKPCPYKRHEIHSLCIDLSSKHKHANEYRRNCILLKKALELQKNQQMIPCFVEDVSASGITFCNPALNNVMRKDRTLEFNLLEMGHKPELMQGTSGQYINATWRKRLYDSKGMAFQYLKGSGKVDCQRLNSNKNAVLIPICTWAHMLKSAINDHNADFHRHLHAFQHHSPDFPGFDDVSTESIDLKELKPCTKFSVEFRRGQVITIQMSAGPLRGIMVPKPVCFKLTDTISFCLLHTKDPVLHLSNYSDLAVSKSFRNATQYVNEWLPLILMESAANTVGCSNDNVSINNVNINFTSGTTGKFVLSIKHCEERNIELSGIQRDEAEKEDAFIKQSCDWLCLKVPLQRGTVTPNEVNYNYWIGHGVITDIKQKGAQSDKLLVNFKLCARAGSFPSAIGNVNAKCSIEILKKSDVDCRTERFIQLLQRSEDFLSKQIAIKHQIPDLDSCHLAALNGLTLDLHYRESSKDKARKTMHRNNVKQQEAIDRAMKSRFTLIQGPPGTGKTNTGIKLIYLFDKINEKISIQRNQPRKSILLCGPSNKSVDLVARWMLEKMGTYCPKFVRVYGKSIEAIDFPIPGKTFYHPKNLEPARELQCVSLHHLIREDGKPFADEIKDVDKHFRDHEYIPMPAKVKEYKKLLRMACEEELKKYHIILCTADVATNSNLIKHLNIQQLIMDEAGMCPEPKCLVPIISSKAEQVVLIGDHMQLRPIIKCKEAAELGMDTSLFERYARMGTSKKLQNNVKFTMLEHQYRMHPRICDIPSKLFYEGKLQTKHNYSEDQPLPIWPQHESLGVIPHVFVHLVGNEEMLTVSTEDGNEMSKSNAEEVDYVVKLYKYLLNQVPNESVYILSQYNAQCSEIKRKLREMNLYDDDVSTVVSSQGGEWDYVIFSTVRSLPEYKIEKNPTLGWCKYNLGFITDQNQVNVAITRAKKGLVIVGNKSLLRCDRTWSKILDEYDHYGCVKTPQEFPPPDTSLTRQEVMARAKAQNYSRHGKTIYEPGKATSYDGPIDEIPKTRFQNRRVRREMRSKPS